MAQIWHLTPPLTEADVAPIRAGDQVIISGWLYTARDAAHQRMYAALARGEALPVDLQGQMIYYTGPTPARPGEVIGSAGPTTSERMDKFTPDLLARGLRATIGKGYRSEAVKVAMVQHKALYLVTTGGIGALLARRITAVEPVAYADLGTEAIRRLRVENFPTLCVNDVMGGDAYAAGQAAWHRG